MKTMKKVLACMLLVAMLASLFSVTALAALDNGSIKITDVVSGDTYEIYCIFELSEARSDLSSNPIKPIYTVSTKWSDFASYVKDTLKVSDYYEVFEGEVVAWKKDASGAVGAEFAALAKEFVKEKSIVYDGTIAVSGVTEITFSNLVPGYYLVMAKDNGGNYKTAGVAIVNPGVTSSIKAKDTTSGLPEIVKEVSDNGTGDWDNYNDAKVGDTVYFKTVITAELGGLKYILTDVLPEGLTLNNDSIAVKGLTNGNEYTLIIGEDKEENSINGFTIKFTQTYLDTLATNDKIEITYSAVLNDKAVMGSTGNTNTATLFYTENGSESSKNSTTKTYTYGIVATKVDKNGSPLAGATFKLSTDDKGIDVIGTNVTCGNDGIITFNRLDAGTYYLTEVSAPNGYTKLSEPIKVVITPAYVDGVLSTLNGTATSDDGAINGVEIAAGTGTISFKVVNGTISLPETGGMGTTLFYVLGAALIVGAAVLLISRRRKAEEN